MDKEELKNVVLEILGSEDENTFSEFLKRIAESLKDKNTLKLDGIGHFQIKKEPLSRMERRGEGSEKNILIFLPEGEKSEKSLLSFEIDNISSYSNEFNESVFEIGVNRPTIISDNESNDGMDSKISEFIESGNVIENFDFFNAQVPISPTIVSSDILEDETEFNSDEITGYKTEIPPLEDRVTEVHINKSFLNNHEEENNDELLEDKIDNKESESDDEFDEISSRFDTIITDDDISESENEISGSFDEIEDENIVDEESVSDTAEGINPFDELDDYIKDETKDEAQDILDEASDEIDTEDIAVPEPRVVEEKENVENKSYSDIRNKSTEWYKKPIFFISLLVAVIAVILLFLFWPSSPSSTEVVNGETIEHNSESNTINKATIDSANSYDKINSSDSENLGKEESTDRKLTDNQGKAEQVKRETPTTSSVGLYRDIPNDQSVTQRIYFDGSQYTVQSSSWKSKSIAEREVNKLKKRGFDAFIFKVFIKSKGSTWNRVRIGYFDSRDEAETFLKKNKI